MLCFRVCILISLSSLLIIDADDSYTFVNPIRLPYSSIQGPFMGIFLAISLPLDLTEIDVFFSINLEANYALPSNDSEFSYPPLVTRRSWDRKLIYDILETKINQHGYSGRNCLLRAICESALYSSQYTGILGDILHIILTPSTSSEVNTPSDFVKAEEYGKMKRSCRNYNKKCSISLLDLISQVGKLFETFVRS